MANITNNNVGNVKFLRNGALYDTHDVAYQALTGFTLTTEQDGTIILARYGSGNNVKTLAGLVYADADYKTITILDVEGASGDVEALRQEINAKLGSGITSANTATAQFEALSGTSADGSGVTSVWGAKAYADDLIGTLDGGVTAETGSYVKSVSEVDGKINGTTAELPTVATITESGKPIVAVAEDKGTIAASAGTINAQYVNITDTAEKFTASNVEGALAELKSDIENLDYTDTPVTGSYVSEVNQVDGKISVTRVALPSSADTAEAMKLVTAVAEDKGQITVSRGEITSSNKTISLSANTDGGIDFKANVDGSTIIIDENTGVMSVASSALVQYEGDTKTIAISPVEGGIRTVSTLLTLSSVTPSSTTVKEEYALKNASGETIGSTIKIYKDSSLVSIELVNEDPTQDPPKAGQFLKYTYIDASGATQSVYVDVSALLVEAEFESGVTANDAGVVHGVVDPTSETFLTVGADGFKLSGVQNAIDNAVSGAVETLDADVTGNSTHVTVGVEEVDGKITAVTVSEDNIANASDLSELSGKTITVATSSNGSITTAETAASDGTTSLDIITDASKIKMSGFTSTDILSGITPASSVTEAFMALDDIISENERVTAAALTDLDTRVDTISGDVEVIESQYLSGVSVNSAAVTVSNHVAPISITAATAATTAATANAIVVNTDANGNITLGLNYIDCGMY